MQKDSRKSYSLHLAKFLKWTLSHSLAPVTDLEFISEEEKVAAHDLFESMNADCPEEELFSKVDMFLIASFHQTRPNLNGRPFNVSLFTLSLLVSMKNEMEFVCPGFSSLVAMSIYWGRLSVIGAISRVSGYVYVSFTFIY